MGKATPGHRFPVPHVRDGQVLFVMDLFDLPSASEWKSVMELRIRLEVTRFNQPGYENTELLCLLDLKRCSGERVTARGWDESLNPNFWGSSLSSVMMSKDFSGHEFSSSPDGHRARLFEQGTIDLSLQHALGEDVLERILALPPQGDHRLLHFVVADDTLVHSGELIVSGRTKNCP
jgi:hypothetical protein